jgi:hypothetical protein
MIDDREKVSNLVPSVKMRDLRRVSYHHTPQSAPCILVRKHAVLISYDPIRVIVMATSTFVFVPENENNSLIQSLIVHLEVPLTFILFFLNPPYYRTLSQLNTTNLLK